MENELLNIFDDSGNHIGAAARAEVHRLGHWHEAFHCWMIEKEEDTTYIYFQLRSKSKKDYPNLLDITAAGHLLANETVADGVREIQEEIGIDVSMDELVPLGVIKYCVIRPGFIDKELANVYLYIGDHILDKTTLQQEEVSGIVRAELNCFSELWLGQREQMHIEGYEIIDGNQVPIDKWVQKDSFVPHEISYYKDVIQLIASNV